MELRESESTSKSASLWHESWIPIVDFLLTAPPGNSTNGLNVRLKAAGRTWEDLLAAALYPRAFGAKTKPGLWALPPAVRLNLITSVRCWYQKSHGGISSSPLPSWIDALKRESDGSTEGLEWKLLLSSKALCFNKEEGEGLNSLVANAQRSLWSGFRSEEVVKMQREHLNMLGLDDGVKWSRMKALKSSGFIKSNGTSSKKRSVPSSSSKSQQGNSQASQASQTGERDERVSKKSKSDSLSPSVLEAIERLVGWAEGAGHGGKLGGGRVWVDDVAIVRESVDGVKALLSSGFPDHMSKVESEDVFSAVWSELMGSSLPYRVAADAVRVILTPRLMGLRGNASRALYSALIGILESHSKAVEDGFFSPAISGLTGPLADLIGRVMREGTIGAGVKRRVLDAILRAKVGWEDFHITLVQQAISAPGVFDGTVGQAAVFATALSRQVPKHGLSIKFSRLIAAALRSGSEGWKADSGAAQELSSVISSTKSVLAGANKKKIQTFL